MKRLKFVAFCFFTILAWQMALAFALQSPSSFICIIVHSSVYKSIKPQLDQYVSDLQREGLNAEIREYTGGSAEDIRSMLKEAYPRGLVGALLIGDVPSAWYEMDVSYPLQPQIAHQEFPMDLFYMDLDGIWRDTDGDGKYDVHMENRAPEIWVGRLKASNMAEDEVSLLQNYFFKNHAYRNGILKLPERALIYVDDFWGRMASEYASAVSLVFANWTIVSDKANTNPRDYLNRLKQGWTLVHLFVHGGSTSHHFYVNNVEDEGQVSSSDIREIDPQALFYILISCWNAGYTARDYMGGWYIFSNTYGLIAISSTKPGDMQNFREFYYVGTDKDVGTAFREWFAARIRDEDRGDEYTKKYFYGLIILGDPTLHMKPSHYQPSAYYATITASGLLPIHSARVYVDGTCVESVAGGQSKKIILLKGSPHNVSVDPFITASEGVRYTCSLNSVILASAGTHEFNYRKQFYLSVNSPYGNVTGSGWHEANTLATFSVSSSQITHGGNPYSFERWSGDSTATAQTTTILMDAPKRVTAVWKRVTQAEAVLSDTSWSLVAGVIVIAGIALVTLVYKSRREC